MPMSLSAFEAANQVIYKAKIQHVPNVLPDRPETANSARDYLDVNGNGQLDHKVYSSSDPKYYHALRFQEPLLTVPLKHLTDQAAALDEGEILTSSDLVNIRIEDARADWHGITTGAFRGHGGYTPADRVHLSNERPLSSLSAELSLLGDRNGCAINTQTGELYIYKGR